MKAQYTLPELFLMLRQNWFKIAVASLLLYMFFNRDLSLQVEMNAPGSKLAKQERTGSWQLPEEPLPQASDKLGLLFSGTEEEAASFIAQPHAADAVRLRRWDDLGKVPNKPTPSLDHFLGYAETIVQ